MNFPSGEYYKIFKSNKFLKELRNERNLLRERVNKFQGQMSQKWNYTLMKVNSKFWKGKYMQVSIKSNCKRIEFEEYITNFESDLDLKTHKSCKVLWLCAFLSSTNIIYVSSLYFFPEIILLHNFIASSIAIDDGIYSITPKTNQSKKDNKKKTSDIY